MADRSLVDFAFLTRMAVKVINNNKIISLE